MLSNSQDILNIVIAVSVFGLAFFMCWSLFYFIMILRRIFKIVQNASNIFRKVDEIIDDLKMKIEHSASYLVLISEGVKTLAEYFINGKDKQSKKKGKK